MDQSATHRLLERLTPLAEAGHGAIVLERVARGAGATRWYFCQAITELAAILPDLRSGSRVGFFFDDRIRREPFSDQVEAEIFDIAATTGEVLMGTQRTEGPEVQMDFLAASEISEAVAGVRSGETVYYGVVPAIEDDGVTCIAFVPPDEDGTVNPQPV
ncbi:MAG TPA: hypothetical protein VH012_07275 [Acidimicrobiales bacterium]|nr:hypothetical protein [Acidimicrobiales bacterium]